MPDFYDLCKEKVFCLVLNGAKLRKDFEPGLKVTGLGNHCVYTSFLSDLTWHFVAEKMTPLRSSQEVM